MSTESARDVGAAKVKEFESRLRGQLNVLVRLKLEDYARWKSVFDELASLRQASGSKGGRLFQKSDNPNEVVILYDWDDLEKARRWFQSDELRQGMQRAGVSGPPDVQYLNEVGKVSA